MPPADGGREAVVVRVVVPCVFCLGNRPCSNCGGSGNATLSAPLADPVDAAAVAYGRAAMAHEAVNAGLRESAMAYKRTANNPEHADLMGRNADAETVMIDRHNALRAAVRAAREGGGKDGG